MSHLMFCCISRNVVKWGPHGVDSGKSRVSTQNQVFHAWHSKYPGFCPKTWVSVKYHENHVQLHHSHVYWHKILREWTMTDQKKPKGSDFATDDPKYALLLAFGYALFQSVRLCYFRSNCDLRAHFRLFIFRLASGKFQQICGHSRWPLSQFVTVCPGIFRHCPRLKYHVFISCCSPSWFVMQLAGSLKPI